ncbi:MAG: helix-turn-helix transcriptional regulator [Kiritimatiellae bacterium]|nr:helix-turn-helix transcriptional regulator [Kiritimatiellia bacterium]
METKPANPGTRPRCADVPGELFAALRRLGARNPFETITVRAIAREAGYSTRTFYNHFRSKYDLVISFYAFDDRDATRRARAGGRLPPWRERVREGLRRFRRDRAMFAGALRNAVGPESFAETFLEHACRSTEEHVLLRTGRPLPPALAPVLRHYFAGFARVLCEWLESPAPESVAAFLADLVAALPSPLRPLLL